MDWSETRSMEMGCWRDVGGTSVLKRGSEWYQFRWFWCSGRLLSEKWVFWWFCSRKGSLWVWPKLRGGAAFTQKSDRLSGWVQKTSFQIWDLTFAPWEQVLWNSNDSMGRGVVDRSSKSSFFNASLAHGHGAPFGSLLHKWPSEAYVFQILHSSCFFV